MINQNLQKQSEDLVSIISHYRRGELDVVLDADHVKKWISQFSETTQEIILGETIHIFSKWYFKQEHIEKFLDSIIDFLVKQYRLSGMYSLSKEVSFAEIQEIGLSQKQLIKILRERIREQYGLEISTKISSNVKHYVYIDDGLYTGSRARKDLSELIYMMEPESTLDVFYLIACTNGLKYTDRVLKEKAAECKVKLSLYRMHYLENIRIENIEYENGEEIRSYGPVQHCLWPDIHCRNEDKIKKYQEYLQLQGDNFEKRMYRNSPWHNDMGIFSSVVNRSIVEREFLVKGIEIVSHHSESKGMYPLGYNLWPSFGFGAFCASDLNISNTCPLVLWSESNWYPLLPRRINNANDVIIEEQKFEVMYYKNDQYNVCPDCGRQFGVELDGGNGFCIDCAWNH